MTATCQACRCGPHCASLLASLRLHCPAAAMAPVQLRGLTCNQAAHPAVQGEQGSGPLLSDLNHDISSHASSRSWDLNPTALCRARPWWMQLPA